MKNLLSYIIFFMFALMIGIVGGIEKGADIKGALWLIPIFTVIIICQMIYNKEV